MYKLIYLRFVKYLAIYQMFNTTTFMQESVYKL